MRRFFNRTTFIVLVPLVLLGGWLLWPLESPGFGITFDPDAIATAKAALAQTAASDSIEKQPNVIVFLADDLAQTDISLYGSQLIQTPNIDGIGKNGITFSDGYVTSPICSPSRAGLLTGRYQQRFGYEFQPHDVYLTNRLQYYGFQNFVNSAPWSPIYMDAVPRMEDRHRQGLPPTEITLAELLNHHGYATAFIGKWHLGAADFALPCNRGFDYSYGFYYSHSLFGPEDADWIVNRHVPEDWTDSYIWKTSRVGDSEIFRNCEKMEEPEYLTQRIAEETITFITENQSKPFFAYVPFSAPHTPLQAPKSYVDQFNHVKDPTERVYLAMIASLDDAVGSVLDKLEELELTENTLIFFLSDNGGALYTMTTNNAPYKGGKVTNFEGGIRVPYMLQWKSAIAPGQQSDAPVSALDIFTTVSNAAGIQLPKDRSYDGIDLVSAPRFAEKAMERPLFWQMGNARAVRKGNWKLLVDDVFQDTLLYNMAKDPYEKQNLLSDRPQQGQELLQVLNSWSGDLPEPLWPGMIYYSYTDENGKVYRFAD